MIDAAGVLALRTREARDRTGTLFVEGVRFVVCAVDAGVEVVELVVAPKLLRSPLGEMLARRIRQRGVPCLRLAPEEFATVSGSSAPQGIGLVVRQPWRRLGDAPRDAMWIAVESVRSQGNLGSILRTGEAVGATGLVALTKAPGMPPEVDPFDPAVVRATMGSLFGQRIVRATWLDLRTYADRAGARIVGAAPREAEDFRRVSYRGPVVLMLGSERKGLSPAQRAACDVTARIPMLGRTDSLNLAVAGSVLLYEAYRQRHPLEAGGKRRSARLRDHGDPFAARHDHAARLLDGHGEQRR
jgi:TrmH family RNA methyltransferase